MLKTNWRVIGDGGVPVIPEQKYDQYISVKQIIEKAHYIAVRMTGISGIYNLYITYSTEVDFTTHILPITLKFNVEEECITKVKCARKDFPADCFEWSHPRYLDKMEVNDQLTSWAKGREGTDGLYRLDLNYQIMYRGNLNQYVMAKSYYTELKFKEKTNRDILEKVYFQKGFEGIVNLLAEKGVKL